MKSTSLLLYVAACVSLTAANTQAKPNIVVIYSDDQGWGDVGYHGYKDIVTPNIDKLAAGGIHFSQGYTCGSVCGPSRSGLLTGVYQQRLGVYGNGKSGTMNPKQPLIFETLKANGYQTAAIGKWGIHIGGDKPLPNDNGVDFFYGFLGGAHMYDKSSIDPNEKKPSMAPIYRNRTICPPIQNENIYLTEKFAQEGVDFIKRSSNRDQPFFLYLAFNAVHSPWVVPKRYIERLKHLKVHHEDRRVFAAMALAMDDGIGRVVETLKKRGVYDNTLIFFMSDNGTPRGQGIQHPGHVERGKTVMSNPGPFNGFKGDTYEGGIRVPFLIHYPRELPKGKRYDHPVINLDIAATIMARIGVTKPSSDAPFKYDGVDLFPYLKGKKAGPPHEVLYWRRGSDYAIRRGDWKLCFNDQGGPQTIRLFNLADDKGEWKDLAAQRPELSQKLQDLFDAWDSTLAPHPNKPLPNRNRKYADGQRTDVAAFNANPPKGKTTKERHKKRKK